MLTVYIHSQRGSAQAEIKKQEAALKKKNMTLVRFHDANFSREECEKYLGSTDLFGDTFGLICDRMLANAEAREFFWGKLPLLVASSNDFYVFEEKLSAEEIQNLKKEKIEIIEDKERSLRQRDVFNIFALSDALGARDKKKLWVLYRQALAAGKSPEEINGTLFWAIKNMLLVSRGGGKSLSPFVKSKAVRSLKKYSVPEMELFAFNLVKNYHESRRGGLPLEEKLEQFILSI